MRRSTGELQRELVEIDIVLALKCGFADPVLFPMVFAAEADRPAVRGFERCAPIGPAADVRAFNGLLAAVGNAAMVPTYPSSVGRAVPPVAIQSAALKPLWQSDRSHQQLHYVVYEQVLCPMFLSLPAAEAQLPGPQLLRRL